MRNERNDLTIVYYTANQAPEHFAQAIRERLVEAAPGVPIVSVSQKPLKFGQNICLGPIGRSSYNIYRQALIGVKEAKTHFVAMAEDDCLYSPQHFSEFRPEGAAFAYDMNIWSLYTWKRPPVFCHKHRCVLWTLICPRELFVDYMEARFAKYPDPHNYPAKFFGEPGRYSHQLGMSDYAKVEFMASKPSVVFNHEQAMGFDHLGRRKRLGINLTEEIPYWGRADEVLTLYEQDHDCHRRTGFVDDEESH